MNRDLSSLSVENLSKQFGKTTAVGGVSFSGSTDELMALVGGNGSGKSTLLRIIAGALLPDDGRVLWRGKTLEAGNAGAARDEGISMVFQNGALCPGASVLENLFLGREMVNILGFLERAKMREAAAQVIGDYKWPLPDLNAKAWSLSGGQQKSLAIARALLSRPKLLLLDEPTAALGVREKDMLLQTLHGLKANGVGIIFCSHSPQEVLSVADRLLVMRQGKLVCDRSTRGMSLAELAMVMST